MKRIFITIISLLFFLDIPFVNACTTAIISGKYTRDGRPLLLKVRDTEEPQNRLMFFNDGKYEYIGLVDSKDTLGRCVWAGSNSMGFAIMNSLSFNLNTSDTTTGQACNGLLMKHALQSCVTLEDFEEMIKAYPQPIGLQANFGVIDAKGGAAYYEIGNNKFAKFDANDPSIAPFGYLIRSNFSFTGDRKEDRGVIRYQTAEDLFMEAYSTNNISFQFLIRNFSRCLKQSLTKTNLLENMPASSEEPVFINYQDFIPNYYSTAAFVVHGVKENESPSLTTIWTVLGFPLCSVAVPAWVKGGKELPSVLLADSSGNSPLCSMALKLKEKVFSLTEGYSTRYINLASIINKEKDGIMQKIQPLENSIINDAEQELKRWREKGINEKEIQEFYKRADVQIKSFYKGTFSL
jgi:hypothetical protein